MFRPSSGCSLTICWARRGKRIARTSEATPGTDRYPHVATAHAGYTIRHTPLHPSQGHTGQTPLDKPALRNYLHAMNIIRRTLDIDAETDSRLRQMADERGQDVAAVLAEAVALLDSVVDIAGPDIGEDRRRLDAFSQTRAAVPLEEVKTWVASWGSASELPRPEPRKI